MKNIAILGSTGSIGTQTLEVVNAHPDQFSVCAIAAGTNVSLLTDQIKRYRPKLVSVASKEIADQLRLQFADDVRITYGLEGLIEVAAFHEADVVVTAVVGSIGVRPTLAAIEAGKTIALANKETLVSAGHLVLNAAQKHGVPLLPVDSEHSAVLQCLQGENISRVAEVILTASGGSFRHLNRNELHSVSVEQALRHPNWSMGAKVTIDSATMMNKGLEVIEAHWLFSIPYNKIKVLLHEESIVHSMIRFEDTAIMAQLGTPDMKVPIQYALSYPERMPLTGKELELDQIGMLHFRKADMERYPCLRYAYEAGKAGGTMPTVLNAANEVAVDRFLRKEIPFLKIEEVIEKTLEQHHPIANPSLEDIDGVDEWARKVSACL